MSLSFSAFCRDLGVPLHNVYWSWCASSEQDRIALFTVWEDRISNGAYVFTTIPRPGESARKPGRTELLATLNRSIDDGYATYGIQCRAVDIEAVPRKRKSFVSKQLLDLRIRRDGAGFIANIVGHIPPSVVRSRAADSAWLGSAAINDLDEDDVTNVDPEYRSRMSGTYVRDNAVRQHVLKRARGVCEFCGQTGFSKPDGRSYLETHHVISLSEQGPDKEHNVIALCANDHRRAHYGCNWKELQDEFLAILGRLGRDN